MENEIDKVILIITHSRKGYTDLIAEAIAEGVDQEKYLDIKPVIKRVGKVKLKEIEDADALVFGSPIYLSYLSGELKHLLDNCHYYFNKVMPKNSLAGKPAAAFTSGKYKDHRLLKLQFTPQNIKTLEHILFGNLMMKQVVKGVHFATHLKNKDPKHPPPLTAVQTHLCNNIGKEIAEAVI